MANLIAAHPQANAEAPSPLKGHELLSAGTKTAGKTVAQIKGEAKEEASAFESELKKEDEKKAALASALLGTPQVQTALPTPNTKTVAVEAQAVKGEKGAVPASQAKTNAKAGMVQALEAKPVNAKEATPQQVQPQVQAAAGKNNLNPLQQLMLSQSAVGTPAAKGAVTAAALPEAIRAMGAQPEIEHDFEVESLDVKGSPFASKTPSFLAGEEASAKRAPTSKVSTDDYLNLRSLAKQTSNPLVPVSAGTGLDLGTAFKDKDSKKDKLEALTGKEAFTGMMSNRLSGEHFQGRVVDAPVTQGTAGKTILSHDAIHQMTQQVNLLNKAQQDGEVKIRLRPDHLGELQMSVKTQGQQVSIEIKAQNSESKKIIEESLSNLKDSLAGQNLTLGRVDIVMAPSHAQNAADQGMQMDMSQFRQNSGQNPSREFEQGNGRQDRLYEEASAPVNINVARRPNVSSSRGGAGLDLIA